MKRSIILRFAALVALETFASSVSMLSRGMILNLGALAYGSLAKLRTRALSAPRLRFWPITGSAIGVLFITSAYSINLARGYIYDFVVIDPAPAQNYLKQLPLSAASSVHTTKTLFVDRFIGIEGALAVGNYPDLGHNLWTEAWKEKFQHVGVSLYDLKILKFPAGDFNMSKYHFVTMPGLAAFLFYPGSFLFLFASMFACGLLAAGIEYLIYRLGGGNLVLCSLLGQVVAYRFAHFGYVPAQSYLLIGAVLLNGLVIYAARKALAARGKDRGLRELAVNGALNT